MSFNEDGTNENDDILLDGDDIYTAAEKIWQYAVDSLDDSVEIDISFIDIEYNQGFEDVHYFNCTFMAGINQGLEKSDEPPSEIPSSGSYHEPSCNTIGFCAGSGWEDCANVILNDYFFSFKVQMPLPLPIPLGIPNPPHYILTNVGYQSKDAYLIYGNGPYDYGDLRKIFRDPPHSCNTCISHGTSGNTGYDNTINGWLYEYGKIYNEEKAKLPTGWIIHGFDVRFQANPGCYHVLNVWKAKPVKFVDTVFDDPPPF